MIKRLLIFGTLLLSLMPLSAQQKTYKEKQNYKNWVRIAPKFEDDFFKTKEEFEQSFNFAEKVGFSRVHCFPYSPREGTPAAKLDFVLSDEEIHRNFDELLEVQNNICWEKNLEYEGRVETVLVEGVSKTNSLLMSGRTDGGKIVNFVGSEDMLGKYVKVKITKAKQWSLEGEIIE